MKFVKNLIDIDKDDTRLFGGKAASLGELIGVGISVPPGFAVSAEAYRLFSTSQPDTGLEKEILQAFDKLDADRVAVRSSASVEDGVSASWAGQLESYLNVDRAGLLARVRDCWQSINADRARAYGDDHGVSDDDRQVGVVVQAMVDSEASGVAFSVNPVTKSSDEMMIEATYGLGEMLVQGMVTPDNYVISKPGKQILTKQIGSKDKMLVYDGQKNTEVTVPADRASIPCLDDQQITELTGLVKKVENYYGSPQDIEWALAGGQFYILQSRPITTL